MFTKAWSAPPHLWRPVVRHPYHDIMVGQCILAIYYLIRSIHYPHPVEIQNELNIATNYTQLRRGEKSVDSDHTPIEMNLNIIFFLTKQTRNIIFNYKSQKGIQLFQELTTFIEDFTNCFTSIQSLKTQNSKWKYFFKLYCYIAFPKIRLP